MTKLALEHVVERGRGGRLEVLLDVLAHRASERRQSAHRRPC